MPWGNSISLKYFSLFLCVGAKGDVKGVNKLLSVDTLREAETFRKRKGGNSMRIDIKIAVLKSGRRQYEPAQAPGVPESTLSKYVRGYGVLSQGHATKLFQLIGLDEEGNTGAEADHGHAAHTH